MTATFFSERARGNEVTHYNRGRLDLYPAPAGVTTIQGNRTDYAAFEQQMHDLGVFDCVVDMVGYIAQRGRSTVRAFRGRTGHFIFLARWMSIASRPAAIR